MTAISPFLALNIRNGTPQLRNYVNATPTSFGSTFGAADTDTGFTANIIKGYVPVVRLGGSQTFLATVGNAVYRSTDGGTTWTSVKTLTGIGALYQSGKIGLWVIYNTGVPTAVVSWTEGGSPVHFSSTTDGATWTSDVTIATINLYAPVDTVVWQGNLVSWWGYVNGSGSAPQSVTYNPSTNSASVSSDTNNGFNLSTCLCVFQNRLFALVQTSSGSVLLREQIGGVWMAQQTIATGISGTAITDQTKVALFTDSTNMYAFWYKGVATTGWQCTQFDSSLTATNITSSVIPAGLDTTATTTSRWQIIVDCRANPGTFNIWGYYAPNGNQSTNWTEYQWNGNSSLMTLVQTGGDVADGMPFVRHSQGDTFFTASEFYVEILGFSAGSAGNITVTYALYSDTGSGTASVQGFFGTGDQAYPLSPATINGVPAGTVTGIPLDGSHHTLTWNAQTDGFTPGSQAKFVLEQF